MSTTEKWVTHNPEHINLSKVAILNALPTSTKNESTIKNKMFLGIFKHLPFRIANALAYKAYGINPKEAVILIDVLRLDKDNQDARVFISRMDALSKLNKLQLFSKVTDASRLKLLELLLCEADSDNFT